jgi:hypothetical protein
MPKPEHINMMTRYQNKLDNRLSQPKLNSPARNKHNTSMSQMGRSIEMLSPTSHFT